MTREEMIRQSEIDYQNRLRFGLVGGFKKGESIIDYLTDEQIDDIWGRFADALALIDYVDEIISNRKRQSDIKNPYKYILTVAEKQFWPLL